MRRVMKVLATAALLARAAGRDGERAGAGAPAAAARAEGHADPGDGPAGPAPEPDHPGRRLPVGSAEPLLRRRGPEPLGHVGDRAVPQLPQLHQRLRGRDRVDRLRRPLRSGRPRAHADGTIRDTGVREGADRRQEHRAADDLPERLRRPALPRHGLRQRAGQLHRNAASLAKYYPAGTPTTCCESGNAAHNRILDNYVAPVLGIPRTSQNLQTLAIFNTFTYGGIGGTQATTSGGSPQGPLISLHEIGHSLGTLADEYPYSSRDVVRPCYTGGEPGSFHHTIMPARRRCSPRRPSGGAGSARRASPAARSACTRAAARSRAASAGRASTR